MPGLASGSAARQAAGATINEAFAQLAPKTTEAALAELAEFEAGPWGQKFPTVVPRSPEGDPPPRSFDSCLLILANLPARCH